ncbi:MAG: protein-disulfide reductase DsbD family protein [Gammaproteobacteria bacterium]|nr:protein-disulfide reductase DsbD family protein [Gammaproteobacteria bacterium]
MTKLSKTLAAAAALLAVSAGCAEPEIPEPEVSPEPLSTPTVFSPLDSDKPLPADRVFVPDVHSEDGALLFRIQMPPGYYLYKDKIQVRSLDDAISLGDHFFNEEWSHSEIVVDEWFGEQEVFFNEAHGGAHLTQQSPVTRTLEVELSYQGCKKDGICYLPQSKVLSVDLPAQLESAADQTE